MRIHPFADGNGRMARLLGNMPLLASGLPPIVIATESRHTYITLLGNYDQEVGCVTPEDTPVLLATDALKNIAMFCAGAWQSTWDEVGKAWAVQKGRAGAI